MQAEPVRLLLAAAVFLAAVPMHRAFRAAPRLRPFAPAVGRAEAACPVASTVPGHARARVHLALAATAVQADSATGKAGATPLVYDGTLTQRQADFSVEDRIKLARMLDDFGMNYIEAGWPTVFPADRVFFVRARDELDPTCFGKLVAMAPLLSAGESGGPTSTVESLLKTGAVNVGVAVNAASTHGSLDETLGSTLKLLRAGRADGGVVAHLHNAMHAYRTDAATVTALIGVACKAGADIVLLVDTGGTATPWEVEAMTRHLQAAVQWGDTRLGVDCRDQSELSVAATLYAARQGVGVLAGTVNGFGGSADLAVVLPVLQLKMATLLKRTPHGCGFILVNILEH
jgi:2-isopropylmalate synthase